MAFDGSGVFNRVYSWVIDKANGIQPDPARFDAEADGFATGLSNCITKDGQTTVTHDIPMNNKKITGLADPVGDTDALNLRTGDARYGHSGALAIQRIYTASGTWTKPDKCSAILVEVQGAGGAGGASGLSGTITLGTGASGAYASKLIDDLISITEATVTVGAHSVGGNGGSSTWDDGVNTISCGGGKSYANGSTPGAASGGDINIGGAGGIPSTSFDTTSSYSTILLNLMSGGSCPLGQGGRGSIVSAPSGYGSGGLPHPTDPDKEGRDGVIRVTEFY